MNFFTIEREEVEKMVQEVVQHKTFDGSVAGKLMFDTLNPIINPYLRNRVSFRAGWSAERNYWYARFYFVDHKGNDDFDLELGNIRWQEKKISIGKKGSPRKLKIVKMMNVRFTYNEKIINDPKIRLKLLF